MLPAKEANKQGERHAVPAALLACWRRSNTLGRVLLFRAEAFFAQQLANNLVMRRKRIFILFFFGPVQEATLEHSPLKSKWATPTFHLPFGKFLNCSSDCYSEHVLIFTALCLRGQHLQASLNWTSQAQTWHCSSLTEQSFLIASDFSLRRLVEFHHYERRFFPPNVLGLPTLAGINQQCDKPGIYKRLPSFAHAFGISAATVFTRRRLSRKLWANPSAITFTHGGCS